jgi:hypothetical protein
MTLKGHMIFSIALISASGSLSGSLACLGLVGVSDWSSKSAREGDCGFSFSGSGSASTEVSLVSSASNTTGAPEIWTDG